MTDLLENLREIERSREAYWRRYPATSPTRLRWRANAARHALHIAPGESVLELGAGSGVWTEHLAQALRNESKITAAVFNEDLAEAARARSLPNVEVRTLASQAELTPESFDYVVGTAMLSHYRWQENLAWIAELLKPGGQMLFLEANYMNPQVFAKANSKRLARWSRNAECQIALRESEVEEAARHVGLEEIVVVPYDILHPRTPERLVPLVQSFAFVLEHLPVVRKLCGTLFISAVKPGRSSMERPRMDLAHHETLRDGISVVVPCHNEAMNIPRLVHALIATYDSYIHEIVLVNDNSQDNTAEVARELGRQDPRVRLLDRSPPPGVGRALRDGYAATSGRYILTMDCDFEMLVPELQDLFDVVAAGHEGAIGSRFSHESVLLNYPAPKLLGNRAFHLILRLFLRRKVRDISNNLKLYRADILRDMTIEQDGFAANAETGLRPLLEGRDVKEVPIAWINRSSDMGVSTFRVARVAPGYIRALARMLSGSTRGA
ncbi:MAG TPA: glycosyltransferase [Solirubrobacteraceae bacterium]|jgi:2-polyprenyl-3-methyl-5-hydroxy-6-metoxy-1,4-benzoquinol methylase|nr:glycosyltransferase [Solirubrobacteraceae bacterium]